MSDNLVHSASETSILIVEDEENLAEVMRVRLESYGYKICGIVSSGEKAIKSVEEMKPDLVIMDFKLKGKIDGIEAAAEIRSRVSIPVIYLTAFSDEYMLERIKVTEPFGYILKPYDGRQLRIAIEIALYKDRVQKEKERLIAELQDALAKVKKLSGLLPICASCKKIRDDKGYWREVEDYIESHSDAEFTHGVCPECAKKLYPFFKKKDE